MQLISLSLSLVTQLAEGLEKARNDSSLIVWDISRASSEPVIASHRSRPGSEQNTSSEDSAKYFDFGK